MSAGKRNLYLILTIICFIGIILVFIFDGYMGVYDTLVMDNGQYPQTIEADQWSQDRYSYLSSMGVERDKRLAFTYEIENHRFSEYSETVNVSLWYNQEKVIDLLTATLTVGAFDNGKVEWTIDAGEIVPRDFPEDTSYNVNLVITRGDIERKIMLNVFPSPVIIKTAVPEVVGRSD